MDAAGTDSSSRRNSWGRRSAERPGRGFGRHGRRGGGWRRLRRRRGPGRRPRKRRRWSQAVEDNRLSRRNLSVGRIVRRRCRVVVSWRTRIGTRDKEGRDGGNRHPAATFILPPRRGGKVSRPNEPADADERHEKSRGHGSDRAEAPPSSAPVPIPVIGGILFREMSASVRRGARAM